MAPNDEKSSPKCDEVTEGDGSNPAFRSGGESTVPLRLLDASDDRDLKITHTENVEEDILTGRMEEELLGPVEDTLCGLGKLRSRHLQKLAHPGTYLFISSIVALVQGMFFTYSNATLSTVEKRFHLPSKVSGFTTTGNDIVQLLLSVHITYLAGQGHRPRWLAVGMLGAAIGCLLAATPHFIFGEGVRETPEDLPDESGESFTSNGKSSSKNNLLCHSFNSSSSCVKESVQIGTEQYTVVSLLLVGQMLGGFASMLYYTIGYSYLDEAVSKDKVPLFLAVSGSLRIAGPVCGYSLAAWSLSYWVNPSSTPTISPGHPGWIGSWWIGYLIIGSVLLVITWSLLLLPKRLPGARKRVLKSLQDAAMKGKDHFHEITKTLRPVKSRGNGAMMSSVRRILTNKVYVLIIINQIFFWFAFFGYITFKPKYLEHQFKMSAAKANQYIAGAAMAAALVGWLGTGSALTFFRPRAKYVISFMAFLSATNCILHLCMVNTSCAHDEIKGMDVVLQSYNESSKEMTDSTVSGSQNNRVSLHECFSDCRCSYKYSPVCAGGVNFYNPCFAGCTSSYKRNKTTIYGDCSCAGLLQNTSLVSDDAATSEFIYATKSENSNVVHYSETIDGSDGSESVFDGYCQQHCSTFSMYLALTVLTKMTHAASRVPVNLILFRCVEERDKDVGLGIFNAALALFSSIPAPIIFGSAIDYSCQLWENTCGQKGFCWLHDLDKFRYILHGIPAALMAACLVTEILLLSMHKTIHFYGDEGRDESDERVSEEHDQDSGESVELKSGNS